MWTISDFPGYAMLLGWGTVGWLACPYCMSHLEAFTLSKSGKQSWFDTHRKFLPANHIFRRLDLEKVEGMTKYPKACYTLDKIEKQVLCEWVKNLRYPDGYASNLARCVDMQNLKLFRMKSHDCHVFMQRLLPIAFRELLP